MTRRAYCVQVTGRPTFYLLPEVQGIVGEAHARSIAADVLGVTLEEALEWPYFNVHAVEVAL